MNVKRYTIRYLIKLHRWLDVKELLICVLFITPMLIISLYILDPSTRISSLSFKGNNGDHQVNHQPDNTYFYYHYLDHEPKSHQNDGQLLSMNPNDDESIINDSSDFNSQIIPQKVKQIVKELEDSLIPKELNGSKIAIIKSKTGSYHKESTLYKWALRKHGFQVYFETSSRSRPFRQLPIMRPSYSSSDWIFLICLDYVDLKDDCYSDYFKWPKAQFRGKIDNFVGLENLFSSQHSFCSTIHQVRKVSSIRNPFTPLCFVLPHQYQPFLDVAEALGYSAQWAIETPSLVPSHPSPLLVDVFTDRGRKLLQNLSSTEAVVRQIVPNPFMLFGSPVTMRFYVAVTSFHPLRAYIHQQGFIYKQTSLDGKNKSQESNGHSLWSFSDFWEYLSRNYGSHNSNRALKSVYDSITKLLLISEAIFIAQHQTASSPSSGSSKFQESENDPLRDSDVDYSADGQNKALYELKSNGANMIAVDVVLNSTFDAWILKVLDKKAEKLGRNDGFLATKVLKTVMDDYISMIASRKRVANRVNQALEWIMSHNNIGIMGLNCHITHEFCLGTVDLSYLLNWCRETTQSNGFVQIYPTSSSEGLRTLFDDLSDSMVRGKLSKEMSVVIHPTWDLDPFLTQIKRFFGVMSLQNQYSESGSSPLTNSYSLSPMEGCDSDSTSAPYISLLHFKPEIKLNPLFSPQITQYYSNVSHNLFMVTIYATAKHCQSEVRMEGKFGSSRPSNHSLGLGLNKITFVVVDISQTDPMVINTYTIYINRASSYDQSKIFNEKLTYQTCYLKQRCDLSVYPRETCDLQQAPIKTWSQYIFSRNPLSVCKNGFESGKWFIPCASCSDESTCFWNKAKWHPDSCKYRDSTSIKLSKCLANHKILFVGDSTNRGLMHYLVERLNHSLSDGSKTHGIRIYNQLNAKKTLIAFNYYPKFWLPTSKRLTFEKTVHQLVERVGPISNNSATVIVFGGVQWLAAQHIHLLVQTLRKLGLEGIRLIMKSLGAGFHQSIDGINTLSLNDMQKVAIHNNNLINLAKSYNIEVVDTFNITIARYKEFYPGKCVCHFHKVSEVPGKESVDHGIRYHIEGDVNDVYSKILLNRLCPDSEM